MNFCTPLIRNTGLTVFSILALSPLIHAQVLVNESFSEANGTTPPSGWSNQSNGGTATDIWQFNNPGNYQFVGGDPGFDNLFAILDSQTYGSGSTQNADLETPSFDAGVGGSLILEFDNNFRHSLGALGRVEVYNGSTWTTVQTLTENNPSDHMAAVHSSINITAAAAGSAAAKVRFHYEGDYSFWWAIDNVKITHVNCTAPVAVFSIVSDCANNQFSVNVNLTDMNGATSLDLTNGTTNYSSPITTTGIYTAGPFADNISQTITLVNDVNSLCNLSQNKVYNCGSANDNCEFAVSLDPSPVFTPTMGNTTNSTLSIISQNCDIKNYGDVWYRFVATETGHAVVVANVVASNPDPAISHIYGISAYSGGCGSLIKLDCNSSDDTETEPLSLNLTNLTIGNTYYARFWRDESVDVSYNEVPGSDLSFNIGIVGAEPSIPLAIQIKSIQARNVGSWNEITWVTAKEEIGDHFELERSKDGRNFALISNITSNGNASDYMYMDKSPLQGINYYRLKLINNDKKSHYSEIVKATVISDKKTALQVYPNPASKSIVIKVYGTQDGDVTLTDISGRVLRSTKMAGSELTMNMSDLIPGIYLIQYVDANLNKVIKVNKQ